MIPLDRWNEPPKTGLEGRTSAGLRLEPQNHQKGDQLGRVTFGTFALVREWNVI
jgi:hypothetical protein